jgi:KipI family sensor histidine kinase inhibitor
MPVQFLHSGDSALIVEFGDAIDRALNDRVLTLDAHVRDARLGGVVETVPTYRSLMIHYNPLSTTAADLIRAVETLLDKPGTMTSAKRTWRVPVCYEGPYAPDLDDVAKRLSLTSERVIELHLSVPYRIYMMGFMPGFPYMGDLDPALVLPRRENPRVRVPPGSVAIALNQTAIYPWGSPGGWHLIGTTPVRLFDLSWDPPTLFATGDTVVIERIDAARFDELRAASESGRFRLAPQGSRP